MECNPACHLRRRWRRWRTAGVWAGAAGQCRRWGWAGSPSLVLCRHRHQHRSAIEVTITARTCWLTHNTHNTCYPLLLGPPNQKSFYFSAHDISIPFTRYSVSTKAGQSTTPHLLSAQHRDCEMERTLTTETALQQEAARVTTVHRTRGLETGDHC